MNSSDQKHRPRDRADNVDCSARDIARSAHGTRRGPRAKYRRAESGWDSLTTSELKVAAFVEEGLSNPEIAARLQLSRRTVATHVSHILKKIDGHSRTDIAREAARAREARAHEEAARARQRGFLARRSARRSIADVLGVGRRKARQVAPSAAGLLAAAARLLPTADRARYAQEYRSELWDLAHTGAGRIRQLRYALRQLRSAPQMGIALRSPRRRSAVL